MKKLAIFGILLILIGVTINYKEDILSEYYQYFYNVKKEVKLGKKNKYYRDYDFLYVQNTDNFIPRKKQDLLNIFYTVINAGKNEFTFYCPKKYENCIDDVKSLAKDQITLSNINNFVHPFNSFKNISTRTDSLGKVTIEITKSYTENDIKLVMEAFNEAKKEVINKNLSTEDQLKAIHDYIIDNSIYDSNRTDNNVIEYKSDIDIHAGVFKDLLKIFKCKRLCLKYRQSNITDAFFTSGPDGFCVCRENIIVIIADIYHTL